MGKKKSGQERKDELTLYQKIVVSIGVVSLLVASVGILANIVGSSEMSANLSVMIIVGLPILLIAIGAFIFIQRKKGRVFDV